MTIHNACIGKNSQAASKLLGSTAINIVCSFFLCALRAFVMRALEKKLASTSKLLGSTAMNLACSFFLHALRVFVMRALEKNSRARANYSGALL